MANLRNSVQLIGNLGIDPDVKELENGVKVARMTLATNESYKNRKGEVVKETQWHNLVAWNNQATIAEKYLEKGKEICVAGKLNSRSYEDSNGVKKYVTEIIVSDILMLGKKMS
ncbi:MAG: single-stranded DNA-binding protein [Flavobacteriales bacterium]|jgi:single-strand DNA-binding protein|nr:single-stranded DNA-binding protein [Flavobacteriales bacterium]